MLSYVVNISDCKCLHVGVTSPFGFKLSASDTPIDGKSPYTLRPYLGRRHGQGRARNLKGGQKGKAKGRPGMAGHRRAANELRCLPHCARELEYEFACELWNCSTICVSLWSIDIMSWKVLEQIGHQTSSNITMPHQCHINATIVRAWACRWARAVAVALVCWRDERDQRDGTGRTGRNTEPVLRRPQKRGKRSEKLSKDVKGILHFWQQWHTLNR